MTVRFVLHDASTALGNDSSFGGPIMPTELVQIAHVLDVQLNRDVAAWWGGNYQVRASESGTDLQPGEIVCAIVDTLPGAPGAVAYHAVDGSESPVVFLARTQCNSLVTGSDSVSSALSHELCETAGDPFVNAWRDDGRGGEYAQELCDAVQESEYVIDGVAVSNFVLPAFFAPPIAGPWDYLGTIGQPAVKAALDTMPGGYQMRRDAGGGETQVQGSMGRRAAKAKHWGSRAAKRGYR